MITFSGRIHAYQMTQRIGNEYVIYCFGGPVPETLDDVPFNLYTETRVPEVPNDLQRYTQLDAVSLYNNHVCHSFVEAQDVTTSDSWEIVSFNNSSLTEGSIAKASFRDVKENTFRHIPQTVDTDLMVYDAYSNTDYLTDSTSFANIFWPTGNTDQWRVRILPEDKELGFYVSADFEYEADLTHIRFSGSTGQAFEGNVDIYGWDDTLNEGQGDWVLHETHIIPEVDGSTIVLTQELSTTKIKLQYGTSTTTYNAFRSIEFFGAEPVVETPVLDEITWALLVPVRPDSAMYDSTEPVTPVALLTAGGPSSNAEAKFNRAVPTAGRANSLIALSIQFLSEES